MTMLKDHQTNDNTFKKVRKVTQCIYKVKPIPQLYPINNYSEKEKKSNSGGQTKDDDLENSQPNIKTPSQSNKCFKCILLIRYNVHCMHVEKKKNKGE